MENYIEYELEDGTILYFEAGEDSGGGRASTEEDIRRSFNDALDSVKGVAKAVQSKLKDLEAQEVEVTFALKATGEVGSGFVFGKVGAEASYTVKLKWVK